MARLPLEGLIVVAVEQAVAAPFCSARLADAGARAAIFVGKERRYGPVMAFDAHSPDEAAAAGEARR